MDRKRQNAFAKFRNVLKYQSSGFPVEDFTEQRKLAEAAGVNAYLEKPVDFSKLNTLLKRYLRPEKNLEVKEFPESEFCLKTYPELCGRFLTN